MNEQKEAIETVITEVCEVLGVDRDLIIDEGGKKHGNKSVWEARQFIIYVLHVNKKLPISTLSNYFNRHKRYAFRLCEKVREGMIYQPYYRKIYADLIEKLPHLE